MNQKDWADRRTEEVLQLLAAAETEAQKYKILYDSFRDLASSCESMSSLDY